MTNQSAEHVPSVPPPAESSSPISAGDIIDGKYLVGECIAWGGMGVVTEATHLHLQKVVALKCVRPEFLENEEMVARFLNEARTAANLRNEHVARVLDFGKTDAGVPYLVMERLEGMSLAALVLQRGQIPVAEAVDYLLQACEALAEAHAQGIVHRDIKPENLFLTRGVDGTPVLKVLDFGISKQLLSPVVRALTNPSTSMGSPCYMSPEQMRNAQLVDRRTDVWSMGAVLFELLAAQPPFDGESMPEICAHVLCDPPRSLKELRDDLPRGLDAVVSRCLEKDRDERFADVAELARALAKFASPAGRASVPSIEHITSNSEPPPLMERPPSVVDASASFAPTLLELSPSESGHRMQPFDPVGARSAQIPGMRSRWGWGLATIVLFAAGGAGAATYLGHDVFLGHDVARPIRGVLIPATMRDESADLLPFRRVLEPTFLLQRGPARAERERERDAVGLPIAEPALSFLAQTPPPRSWQGNANTVGETPHETPVPATPDDPFGIPAGP